jgi:hypothetical protein
MKNNGTKRNASRLLIQPSIRLSKHNMEKTLQVDIDFIQTPKVKNLYNFNATYKKNVITAVMSVEVSIILSKRFIVYFEVLFSRYKIS